MGSSNLEVELYKKYRPTKFSELFGQEAAVKALTEMGKRGGIPHAILLAGESGCLRGDTPIPDPSDGTSLTIEQRWRLGKPFHVLSYAGSGKEVVAEAMPPVRYSPSSMFRVETSESVFYGTPEHRVLLANGQYLSLKELYDCGSFPVLLMSTSGLFHADRQQDVHRCWQTAQDLKVRYSAYSRPYDVPLLGEVDSDLSPLPLLGGVQELSRLYEHVGDQAYGSKRTHHDRYRDLPSKRGYQDRNQLRASAYVECLSGSDFLVRPYLRDLTQQPLSKYWHPLDTFGQFQHQFSEKSKALASVDPYVGLSGSGQPSIKSITPADQDRYFDFHVPVFNNYWAEGIFHHNCGKTTIARILRKRLNCSDNDYVELDSAQFRGIDTVREIRTKMHLSPIGGDCRVYLLDEAHQLTGAAADALLKMLEDTPPHVYFFLCTTDPQKLKNTIKTRCTQITVKALGRVDSLKLIESVAAKEEKTIPNEVKDKIIEVADGSARKTLVLLNSVIGLKDEESQLEYLNTKDAEAEAINLCRVLFNPKAKFVDAARILRDLKEEPEQLRWMVLGFAKSAILKGGTSTGRAYQVICAFRDNFFDSKHAGLAAACYEVLEG